MEGKETKSEKKEEIIEKGRIFSEENVNVGHQPEIDYFKTFITILIIVVHVYSYFNIGYFGYFVYTLIQILGAPGCQIQTGIGMKYTRHHEISNYVSRGIVLLTMGQYINLIRNGIPSLIAWWITGDKLFISRVLLFLQTDVLHFAGLSFLLIALLKKHKLSDISILIFAIIMNSCAFLIYKIIKSPDNYLLSQFIGFFVFTTNTESILPFCSYFIFIALGHWFGGILQKVSNKDKFYNLILIICLPITLIYYCLRACYEFPILPPFLTQELYSLNPIPDSIIFFMSNIASLAVFHKIHNCLKGKTPEFVKHTSRNFTQYYMVGYVITMQMYTYMKVTRGEKSTFELKYPTILGLMLVIICRILIDINNKYIHFTIINLKNPTRNLVFALIWIMTIIILIYTYPKVECYTTQWNFYYCEK